MPNDLPQELTDDAAAARVAQLEQRCVTALLWCSPFVFVGVCFLTSVYGRTILYLQPPSDGGNSWFTKMGCVVGVAVVFAVVLWWITLRISKRLSTPWQRSCSFLLAGIVVLGANVAISHPRLAFAFQESVKSRAPQLSYARNIVFMQQNLATPKTDSTRLRIGLVGSSQINLGVNSDQLSTVLDADVVKFCLPGMVPLQYQALADSIAEQDLDVVVCWLSEFDFFREQNVPASRLRWSSTRRNVAALSQLLSRRQLWENRANLADLCTASCAPTWTQRELFQLLAKRFWWRFDSEEESMTDAEKQIGAKIADQEKGVQNARKNIKRTDLLDVNFLAFADFHRTVTRNGATLLVLEGETHPETMQAYPAEYRAETRERLTSMSEELEFELVHADRRQVQFSAEDWIDAVHLNKDATRRLTECVASNVKRIVQTKRSQPISQ